MPLSPWKKELATRWDGLRNTISDGRHHFESIEVAILAKRAEIPWYVARGQEPIAKFLAFSGEELIRLPAWGRTKIERLCSILEHALSSDTHLESTDETECIHLQAEPDPFLALKTWGVPETLSLDLVLLPIRALNFFEENGIEDLGGVLRKWKSLNREGFLALRNIGKKTVSELELFYSALASNNWNEAGAWLPIQPGVVGLSFQRALLATIAKLNPIKRKMLELRLVKKFTLEESSAQFHVTRERVRQVEAKFVESIENVLNWFPHQRNEMMLIWVEEGDWMNSARPVGSQNDELLIAGGLEAIFEDTPYGIARSLSGEEQVEAWEQAILSEADFYTSGISLNEFMERLVPEKDRAEFCDLLTKWPWLHLDHTSGRIFRDKPKLTDVIRCLLASEDDPMPLTWLVTLVQKTRGHDDVKRETLLRMRPRLKAEGADGSYYKILWNE